MSRVELGSDEGVFVIRCPDGVLRGTDWSGNTLVSVLTDDDEQTVLVHTGEQFGPFAVTVQQLSTAPPDDDAWPDVVDLSLTATGAMVVGELVNQDPAALLTTASGSYRVRVAARGRGDRAWSEQLDPAPYESYLIQAWPAPVSEPRVVRQTSGFARDQLAPQPPVSVAGREAGLAGAAAIGRDVNGDIGARRLSGKSGTVVVAARLPGTRRRHFLVVAHHSNWSPAAPSWGFIVTAREDYELNAPTYSGASGNHEDQLCGLGMIRTTLVEVDRPARAVSTWDWLVSPPGRELESYDQMIPFLPATTRVTSTLTQSCDDDGDVWTEIRVEHSGVPVEWLDDLRAWREYQLAVLRG